VTVKTTFALAVTNRPQRAMSVFSRSASVSDTRRRKGTLRRSTLWPRSPSTAGSSELAISTVVSTPSALPMPSLVMKSRPKNARPLTEMATVRPANSTARPAVEAASAAASRGGRPSCRNCRKRVTMKSE
jgi:hypothetical protein